MCKHEEDIVCTLYFLHLARATYVILIIIHIQIFVGKQGITIFLYLQTRAGLLPYSLLLQTSFQLKITFHSAFLFSLIKE